MNKIVLFGLFVLMFISILFLFRKPISYQPEVNIKVCDDFNYSETKIICYALFLNDTGYCNLVDNFNVDCFKFATVKNIGKDFCNNLGEQFIRTWCFSNLAIKEKDPSICEKNIDDILHLETCLDKIPIIYYNNYIEDYCLTLNHESSRYTCLAMIKNDLEYCKKIKAEPWSEKTCEAVLTNNVGVCQDVEMCYMNMAIIKGDITLCNFIEKKWVKAECIGITAKDIVDCSVFSDPISKDLCKLYLLSSIELGIE